MATRERLYLIIPMVKNIYNFPERQGLTSFASPVHYNMVIEISLIYSFYRQALYRITTPLAK